MNIQFKFIAFRGKWLSIFSACVLTLSACVLTLLVGASIGYAKNSAKVDSEPMVILIRSNINRQNVKPEFFGTNNLYWIDDNRAWGNEQFIMQLKSLGIQSLRFPGGEVADNYDWETNRLERHDRFPYEAKTELERKYRIDYKNFLKNARAAHISKIFFVVNLEGAFFRSGNVDDNINLYAEKAARWVKAVRDSGYRVEYWEIGNESYLKSFFMLTAQEYAKALKVFYKKMKAADPTIKIGAIGPHDIDAIALADQMIPSGLASYRSEIWAGNSPCEKGEHKACLKKFGIEKTRRTIWWDTILGNAADSFDFAVVHRYRMLRSKDNDINHSLMELRSYIERAKRKPVELAVTEWNTPNQSYRTLSDSEHALEIAEQVGNYVEGGVNFIMYWPLRLAKHFSLLSINMQPTASYHTLALANRYINGEVLSSSGNNTNKMYILSTKNANTYNVLLINKKNKKQCLNFVADGTVGKIVLGEIFSNINDQVLPRKLSAEEIFNNGKTVCIEGNAVAGLSLTNIKNR